MLHSDASQAPNYLGSMSKGFTLTFDALKSKVYGPKGAGALFIRRNTVAIGVWWGKQEAVPTGNRNVANAVGFAAALHETVKMRERESARVLGRATAITGFSRSVRH